MSQTTHVAEATHLMVTIAQDGKPIAYRVLNLAHGDYRPLVKELAWRAVAGNVALAGAPWRIALALEGVGTVEPLVRVEALADEPDDDAPLATLRLPIGNLTWVAAHLAARFQVRGDYTMFVKTLASDDDRLRQWAELNEDPDFELAETAEPPLLLPSGFSAEPVGPRRALRPAESWLRCVFRPDALAAFLDAAAQEAKEERGWAVATRIHLAEGCCYSLVEELVEMPATAGRSFLVTHGRDFLGLRGRLGERLGGFCHLHPPDVEGQPLAPHPSGPDTVVAWNLDAATPSPIVAPIAMFGTTLGDASLRMAAHGHQAGVLSEIALEVLT